MNKKEFVKAVAAESGLTGVDTAKAVDAMQRVVSVSMQRGESIIIPGFGSFSLKECKARMGRNPRTGEPLKIPAKRVVRFSPSKNLMPQSPTTTKGGAKKKRATAK